MDDSVVPSGQDDWKKNLKLPPKDMRYRTEVRVVELSPVDRLDRTHKCSAYLLCLPSLWDDGDCVCVYYLFVPL